MVALLPVSLTGTIVLHCCITEKLLEGLEKAMAACRKKGWRMRGGSKREKQRWTRESETHVRGEEERGRERANLEGDGGGGGKEMKKSRGGR